MTPAKRKKTPTRRPASERRGGGIEVTLGGHTFRQPGTMQLCPLGLQFYSDRPVAEYTLLDFNLKDPARGGGEDMHCTGAVVHCRKEDTPHQYRVWVNFVEMSPACRRRMHQLTRKCKSLCSFCENF